MSETEVERAPPPEVERRPPPEVERGRPPEVERGPPCKRELTEFSVVAKRVEKNK